MFIWAQTLSLYCTADLAIEGDESSKGTTFKKNDGEKEDNNLNLQEGVKKVEKKCERSNVYTNPLTNPQRNPNVDPRRTEPLTDVEIKAIKEAHQQSPEFLSRWDTRDYSAGAMINFHLFIALCRFDVRGGLLFLSNNPAWCRAIGFVNGVPREATVSRFRARMGWILTAPLLTS